MSSPLDTSDLDTAPKVIETAYRDAPRTRVYLVTTYSDGSTWHRTGYIGRTTGRKPAYLLVGRSSDNGSSDLLSGQTWQNTIVEGVQRGPGWGYFHPVTCKPVKPGRNRYADPT